MIKFRYKRKEPATPTASPISSPSSGSGTGTLPRASPKKTDDQVKSSTLSRRDIKSHQILQNEQIEERDRCINAVIVSQKKDLDQSTPLFNFCFLFIGIISTITNIIRAGLVSGTIEKSFGQWSISWT